MITWLFLFTDSINRRHFLIRWRWLWKFIVPCKSQKTLTHANRRKFTPLLAFSHELHNRLPWTLVLDKYLNGKCSSVKLLSSLSVKYNKHYLQIFMDPYLHVQDYYFNSQLSIAYFCRFAYRIAASCTTDLPKAHPSATATGIDKLQWSDKTRSVRYEDKSRLID